MNQESGWKVVDSDLRTGYIAYIVDQDNWDVALVSRGKAESAIDRARVIAVAPEMAHEIEEFLKAWDSFTPAHEKGQIELEAAMKLTMGYHFARMRALLAQIKGEEATK